MKNIVELSLKISVLFYAIAHLVTHLLPMLKLDLLLSVSGLFTVVLTTFYLGIHRFKLPFMILVTSIIISLSVNVNLLETIRYGMLQMREIIGLIVIMPLMGWILHEEPYIESALSYFNRFFNTSKKFHFGTIFFTQIISFFLVIGSIPVMYQSVNVILKDRTSELWKKFKSTAILRGFSLSLLWVVSIPSFIYAVETLGSNLWLTILQGMGIAFTGTLLSIVFIHYEEKKYNINFTTSLKEEFNRVLVEALPKKIQIRLIIEFSLLFVSLFGTVFILHSLFKIKLMILIPLIIMSWVIIFYVLKRRLNKLTTVLTHYFNHNLTDQAYMVALMLSVGLLIYSLNQTNFSNIVVDGITFIQHAIPFINILYLLPFIIIILGLVGLGPLTVMVLVAGVLESMSFPYPPELLVLAVTSGSVISNLISPLVVSVILLSASNQSNVIKTSIRSNWSYALGFYIVSQTYLQLAVYFNSFG